MKKIFMLFLAVFGFSTCFGINGLSSADIANKAKFLGFDGNYSGSDDDFLSFDGNGDFFSETFRSFTLSLTNGTDENKEIHLFPTYIPRKLVTDVNLEAYAGANIDVPIVGLKGADITITLESTGVNTLVNMIKSLMTVTRTTKDGVYVNDGIIYKNVAGDTITCQGAPNSVDNLMQYLVLHPTLLSSMKLKTSNAAQFQQNIKVTSLTPFKTEQVQPISLSRYTTNKDQVDTMIDVPISITAGDLTDMSINMLANTTLDITMFFGATYSSTQYVASAVKKAQQTLLLNGSDRVILQSALKQIG